MKSEIRDALLFYAEEYKASRVLHKENYNGLRSTIFVAYASGELLSDIAAGIDMDVKEVIKMMIEVKRGIETCLFLGFEKEHIARMAGITVEQLEQFRRG